MSVKQKPRPEFSRPITPERLAEAPFSESIRASAEECEALVERLELRALRDLSVEFDVLRGAGEDLLEAHSGMFPCFLGGFVSRLVDSISRDWMIRGRVSSGWITSSM